MAFAESKRGRKTTIRISLEERLAADKTYISPLQHSVIKEVILVHTYVFQFGQRIEAWRAIDPVRGPRNKKGTQVLWSEEALEEFLIRYPDTKIVGNPLDVGSPVGWVPKNEKLAAYLEKKRRERLEGLGEK